jgi:DNA primase
LSNRSTGVPHGGFNVSTLRSDYPFVVVTEAAIDALSLIEAGVPNVMAIIGIGNDLSIDAIARSGKRIWLALDNDPKGPGDKGREGQKATAKIIERLHSRGLAAFDFTGQFADIIGDYKDWNAWWKNQGRHLGVRPLEHLAELLVVTT